MSIQLPSKPWAEGDTFTNDATGVEYTYDGVKWLASGGEELPAGTIASDTPPENPKEGASWYDTVRLELFIFTSDSWLPSSPLGARVSHTEEVQTQIIKQLETGLDEQSVIKSDVLGCLKLTGGQMTGDLSTQNIDMGTGHAILQNGVEKITFGEKVEIQKAGDAGVDGFTIRGRTPKGIDANLLAVFHNSSGNDAVNYEGRQDGPSNLVTSKWVADRIAEISPPPVHYSLVSFKAHAAHVADGYEGCWWATDAAGNATTATGSIASIYYHAPAGHYILKSIGTTDFGEIMLFNDGFVLRYHGMAKKTSIKNNIIRIDVNFKEGSGSMAYGGIFTLDIMNCFRETSASQTFEDGDNADE
jgi:hypothetical protein